MLLPAQDRRSTHVRDFGNKHSHFILFWPIIDSCRVHTSIHAFGLQKARNLLVRQLLNVKRRFFGTHGAYKERSGEKNQENPPG
jgi:hypothetical protein